MGCGSRLVIRLTVAQSRLGQQQEVYTVLPRRTSAAAMRRWVSRLDELLLEHTGHLSPDRRWAVQEIRVAPAPLDES